MSILWLQKMWQGRNINMYSRIVLCEKLSIYMLHKKKNIPALWHIFFLSVPLKQLFLGTMIAPEQWLLSLNILRTLDSMSRLQLEKYLPVFELSTVALFYDNQIHYTWHNVNTRPVPLWHRHQSNAVICDFYFMHMGHWGMSRGVIYRMDMY